MSTRVHPGPGRIFSLLGAALVVLNGPRPTAAATGTAPPPGVIAAAAQLRKVWMSDPSSRATPFPKLELTADAAAIRAACPSRPDLSQATGRAAYCPERNAILIDGSALGGGTASSDWFFRYWIAVGLAESLSWAQGASAKAAAPVISSLENNCLAGTLISASGFSQQERAEVMIAPALSAFPLSRDPMVGTKAQRGYALLTGLGATDLSCSAADMLLLSQNQVPDPAVLTGILEVGTKRGSSSLLAVLSSQCRPRPLASCPRKLMLRNPGP